MRLSIIISFFLLFISQITFGSMVDNVYLNTVYQVKEINDNDSFLKKYYFKDKYSEFDKGEINATLEDREFFSTKNFYHLIAYAELLHKIGNEELSQYYRNLCFIKYKNNVNYNLYLFVDSYRYGWSDLQNKVVSQIQQYRLLNNIQTYLFMTDLLVSTSKFDKLSSPQKDSVVMLATSLNSSDISIYIYKLFKDITELRFAYLSKDIKQIIQVMRNDFYNQNMGLINSLRFVALFFNILFIIIGFLILLRRRKLIYHKFIHKLPKNAPVNVHRFFFILITLIFYLVLGVNGLIILYSFFIIKFVTTKERTLLAVGGILFLLNFFIYQGVYFMFIPLNHNSPYYVYYESVKEGYNEVVLKKCDELLSVKPHPFLYAAKAVQENNKGNYGLALENWNKYLEYSPEQPEVKVNIANIYFRLGNQKNAKKLYEEVLESTQMPIVYYNMAKLYLENFDVAKYNDYISKATKLSPYYITKYIADNNKFVGSKRASKLLDAELPIDEYYHYIIKDAYNSKYKISGLSQIFVVFKLLIFILFVLYVLTVKNKHLRLCKTCGMQVCYDCVQKDGLCPICNSRLENVKSKILVNKIKMDIKYNSNLFNMTIYQIVGFFLPGAYDLLHGSFKLINIVKIVLMSFLWTLVLFDLEVMGVYKTTYIVEHFFAMVSTSLLILIYIYNFIKVIKKYSIERSLIVKS